MAELYLDKNNEPVDANLVTDTNAERVATWCGGVKVIEHDAFHHDQTYSAVNVPTATGMVRAGEGDWVVRSPQGDFYVLPPHKFQELFEPVK